MNLDDLIGYAITPRAVRGRARMNRIHAAVARIHGGGRASLRRARGLRDVLARAKTREKQALRTQPLEGRSIKRRALRLHVGRTRSGHVGAFVPVDDEPAQLVHDLLRVACTLEREIEDFYP